MDRLLSYALMPEFLGDARLDEVYEKGPLNLAGLARAPSS